MELNVEETVENLSKSAVFGVMLLFKFLKLEGNAVGQNSVKVGCSNVSGANCKH